MYYFQKRSPELKKKKNNLKKFPKFSREIEAVVQKCSVKKLFFRNFAKFTGKRLCQGLFFNKVAGQSPATLLKKTLAQVFSFEFCEISKNTFFTEHLRATVSISDL